MEQISFISIKTIDICKHACLKNEIKIVSGILSGMTGFYSFQVAVYIRVVFLKIGEIDTLKENFAADAYIQARWREPQFDHQRDIVCANLHCFLIISYSAVVHLRPIIGQGFALIWGTSHLSKHCPICHVWMHRSGSQVMQMILLFFVDMKPILEKVLDKFHIDKNWGHYLLHRIFYICFNHNIQFQCTEHFAKKQK